jgi:hypothetical protein
VTQAPFDLARLKAELDAAPVEAPVPLDLAVAILADLFRDAGVAPPPDEVWPALCARGTRPAHRPGQLAALARLIMIGSSLRPATVAALAARPPGDPVALVEAFLEAVFPVTAELVAENPFRREETVRRWIETVGGAIAGETALASRQRLEQLDYRRTLAEYEKAEKSRLVEAKKRAEALRKAAAEAAEAAKGWRE